MTSWIEIHYESNNIGQLRNEYKDVIKGAVKLIVGIKATSKKSGTEQKPPILKTERQDIQSLERRKRFGKIERRLKKRTYSNRWRQKHGETDKSSQHWARQKHGYKPIIKTTLTRTQWKSRPMPFYLQEYVDKKTCQQTTTGRSGKIQNVIDDCFRTMIVITVKEIIR